MFYGQLLKGIFHTINPIQTISKRLLAIPVWKYRIEYRQKLETLKILTHSKVNSNHFFLKIAKV